jgi:hypothetical protein
MLAKYILKDRLLEHFAFLSHREIAPPVMVALHGKYPFLCHAPGCATSAGALFVWKTRLTNLKIYI